MAQSTVTDTDLHLHRNAATGNVVYEDEFFIVFRPQPPHCFNSREDGGHLILIMKVPVHDRSDLSYQQAIDFMRLSMAVGRAMYDVLGVERMNYEDLGNWGIDDPGGAKMHLHFLGRARKQVHQIRGHHISLFPKGHEIYKGHLESLTDAEVSALREKIIEILRSEKYVVMAQQAGIPQ